MSALDKFIDDNAYNVEDFDSGAAARAELAALRQRLEDAELILRRALNTDDTEGYWITHTGTDCGLSVGEEEDGEPIVVDLLMRDGLPVLTDEARAALRKSVGP